MSINRIVTIALIFALSVITVLIYPSTANSTDSRNFAKKDATTLTNIYPVSVSSDAVISHYFGKDVVDKIMKQHGVVGVRLYYGKHENGKSGFTLVGIDKYGKDLAPVVITGPIPVCPPWCGN